jgi:EAL domain-containing protein (putative c-di-GMP-specific phosphodiesterase class I)
LHVEASVGIALCPLHCDHHGQLLQRADVAMYAAKMARGHVAAYTAAEDPHSRARLETVEQLRAALELGELMCYYQPKVNTSDGAVHSVEALVRWQHPTRGLLSPDQFLPLAEQTGLMRPLTAVVLDLALGQVRQWLDEGIALVVSVNLSVTNLLDVDLPADIARLLRGHDLPASALTLEITESVLMADSVRAKAVVEALHSLGVGLSIDDYGTGYSSLAYLQDLAVDELKLDRAFVSRLTADPRSAAIVRSTVQLAHSLGLRLVAEGVEDAATLAALQHYGCDLTQGFHHSRPLPADQLGAWLTGHPSARLRPVRLGAL